MRKYLFYFGYIGTRFRGVQKNKNLGKDDYCITRCLEEGLLSLSPLNTPIVYNSSRTDQGVHAIRSTFHTELDLPPIRGLTSNENKEAYLTFRLNEFMEKYGLEIRIYKVRSVPCQFHSRHCAIRRTYLYRLVHLFDDISVHSLPILEVKRCQFVRGDFDIEAVKEVCDTLKGTHDFRQFTKFSKNNDPNINTQRTIEKLEIVPGTSFSHPLYEASCDQVSDSAQYWDVIISSRSFLRNQVRRIVGLLVAVGQGKIDKSAAREALLNPQQKWNSRINVAKAEGLYLMNIEYPPEAFLEETYEKS